MNDPTAPSGICEYTLCDNVTGEGGNGTAARFCCGEHRGRYYNLLRNKKDIARLIKNKQEGSLSLKNINQLIMCGYTVTISKDDVKVVINPLEKKT